MYLAEHIHLKASVAIKLLYGKLANQDVQAFLNEAQTVATLRHPHILRVLDFGFEQALPFFVMDYAPGGTLRDRHPGGSLVALPVVISYTKQIAAALEYAHVRKLIHRDVKPENMLIDADGNVLLGDFGIAATAHSTASMKTIDNTGTVHYMAPEQIQGKPRPQSDQYALAIVVYELLCGERPFQGSSPIEVAMQQLSTDPAPLRHKNASLLAGVEQVVLKALSKDPRQRFKSVQAFAEALKQATSSIAVTPYGSGGILTLEDPLRDNSQGNGWTEAAPNSIGGFMFIGGAYHGNLDEGKYITSRGGPSFKNFTMEAQITILKGNCGGIIFRADKAGHHYLFQISSNGDYGVYLYSGPRGMDYETLHTGYSQAIRTGFQQMNLLAAVAVHQKIRLFVNRQLVYQMTDESYSIGQCGFAIDSSDAVGTAASTEVMFKNLKVWML